jgi:uncharacterized protein (DUF1697 family)
METAQLALLRGINVGGKNKLPMRELVGLFEEAGCANVRSFIQSGNIIFTASSTASARLAITITAKISERFGYKIPVVLRTAQQLRDVVSNNPFLQAGSSADILHVMFLADRPDAEKIAALDPNRSSPDAFAVRGREIYLQLPGGMGNSKLSNAWFDSKLSTTSTARNWRTVLKLLEMMETTV